MSDQAAFLDEITQFGDPWHGLFRNGVLELPNATTRTISPTPTSGDCFDVVVPGTPAATTSSADAAAGMTWLDYGLISGAQHRFYATALGPLKWIYVAPDGVAWIASLTWSGLNTANITLVPPFGITPSQSLSVTCAPTLGAVASVAAPGVVMDISQNGRAVAFLLKRASPSDAAHDPQAIMLLEITGNVPSASATLTLRVERNRSGYDGVTITDDRMTTYTETRWEYDTSTTPPGERSFTVTWSQPAVDAMVSPYWPPPASPWVIGTAYLTEKRTSGTWHRYFVTGHVFQANVLVEVRDHQRQVFTDYGYTDDLTDKTWSGSIYEDYWLTIGATTGTLMPIHYTYSGVGETPPVATLDAGVAAAAYTVHPLSNRLWCMFEVIADILLPNPFSFYPPLSPAGQSVGTKIPAPYSGGYFPSAHIPFATYHPISEAVVFHAVDNGVVCWV